MSKERGKIRAFFVEIEGSDDSLQEGLKNLGLALGRALTPPARSQPKLLGNGGKGKSEVIDGEAEEIEADPIDDDALFAEAVNSKPKKNGSSRRTQMPKVIDLDLQGKTGTTFEEFIAQKRPEGHSDRFLVIASWLKDHGGVDEITADHVFTCYKIAGWTPHPASYYTVLSDMKRKQKSLDKGAATGAYKINLNGMNIVAKMGSAG